MDMLYLLKVMIYTFIMLLIYILLLRNKTHHGISRLYLLLTVVMPIVIPFIRLPDAATKQIAGSGLTFSTLPEVLVTNAQIVSPGIGYSFSWLIAYGAVATIFLVSSVSGFLRLWLRTKREEQVKLGENTLVLNTGVGPGSFGRYIIFPGKEVNPVILAHEEAHIHLGHTYDLVLLAVIQAAFWPNIFLYFIMKELKEVHEFQADCNIMNDKNSYAELILSSTFNVAHIPLMHSFINHPIKRRIMMLKKESKSTPLRVSLQVLMAAAVFLSGALIVQSCDKKQPAIVKESSLTQEQERAAVKKTEGQPITPDVQPNFIGDGGGMSSFLSKELKYPAFAREHKLQGKVIVKFIISKTGKITSPEVVRSPDTSLSRAALEVINKMPDWSPAEKNGEKIDFTFYQPINFKL